jgi:hypothetical protein
MTIPWEIALAGTGGGSCLLMEPHGFDSRPAVLTLQGEEVSGPSGAGFLDKDGAGGATQYEFRYVTESRPATAFLRNYFDARMGRKEPFWFAAWDRQFEIANVGGGFAGDVWVNAEGYATTLFPLGAAYRRFVLLSGANYADCRVIGVTLGTPTVATDKLTLSSGGVLAGAVAPYTEASGVNAIPLRFGRFDSDNWSMQATGDGCADITLTILELPAEATEP